MDELTRLVPVTDCRAGEKPRIPRIAIIGRPNVGKSSFINALIGEDRMIVSPVAGTTRDAVDSLYQYYGRKYVLVDTAGIRSRGKISRGVEKYSVMRAIKSLDRADIALVLIDAVEGITEQDERIVGLAHEAGKGIIIILNKWDLVTDKEEEYKRLMAQVRAEAQVRRLCTGAHHVGIDAAADHEGFRRNRQGHGRELRSGSPRRT